MNKAIEIQLNKCRVATIPDFSDVTTELVLKKQVAAKDLGISEGDCYKIKVDDYIIHPYSGFTLHANWNNGIIPTDYEMNIEVTKVMGKMIKVEALGMNDNKPWSGWLPSKSFEILEKL